MRRGYAKALLWLALALPALWMVGGFVQGRSLAMDLLGPTGELSIQLLIAAMLPGPLSAFFGANAVLRVWLSFRRNIGVAAFGYAVLHLFFYLVDMPILSVIIDELTLPAIWTGWIAFALLLVPAAISFDKAMRFMGAKRWKNVQRIVYAALLFSVVHWLLLDWAWQPAAIHMMFPIAAWTLWAVSRHRRRVKKGFPA